MENTKKSLLTSVVALLLCFAMLLGTTYAWFTDSAISGGNIIQSGSLDIEMYWSDEFLDANSSEWTRVEGDPIFTYDNWEPGYSEIRYVKIANAGNLAFKWKLNIEAQGEVTSALGRLIAVAENYPELKANQNFIELQSQLEGTENRIAVERQRYNEVVKAFNKRVVTFPNNIFASLFGFSKRDFFASQQGADVAPVVEF